jgi:hypothetical protein
MRYLRLKNARKWRICHIPNAVNEKIVNQAKLWTRSFVDTASIKNGQRRGERKEDEGF